MINDKPGRDLDSKIAFKVFGYPEPYESPFNGEWCIKFPEAWKKVIRLPQYSTTWNGMQLVVEEMQRRGYSYRCGSYETVSSTWKHWANFEDELKECNTVVSDTLPHAVCKAALKALEDDNSADT